MLDKYDYLVVGAGLFGCTFARKVADFGKTVLIIDKRDYIGGNCADYLDKETNSVVSKFGAHIFHTNDTKINHFVDRFTTMIPYNHQVMANYEEEMYSLPFNLFTYQEMYNIQNREGLQHYLGEVNEDTTNLETYAISKLGRGIYEKLVKGYTEKQWGRDCKELPASILGRLPIRDTYNTSYFNDTYVEVPFDGYTRMMTDMVSFKGIDILLGNSYNDFIEKYGEIIKCDTLVWTGSLDELFDYKYYKLPYRSINFENEVKECKLYQEAPVINYTSKDIPYTRIVEHKQIRKIGDSDKTIITKEYPCEWEEGKERMYPIHDKKSEKQYEMYRKLVDKFSSKYHNRLLVGGRLGDFQYYDMDDTIGKAIELSKEEIYNEN